MVNLPITNMGGHRQQRDLLSRSFRNVPHSYSIHPSHLINLRGADTRGPTVTGQHSERIASLNGYRDDAEQLPCMASQLPVSRGGMQYMGRHSVLPPLPRLCFFVAEDDVPVSVVRPVTFTWMMPQSNAESLRQRFESNAVRAE